MIVLIGIPTETPMRMLAQALDALGYAYVFWNQRLIARNRLDFEINAGVMQGLLTVDGVEINLIDITGAYVRLMDDTQLPELRDLPYTASARQYARAQHEALMLWLDLTPARVANRPSANGSNGSKPWQSRLIRDASSALSIPDTLLSNDPASVRAFRAKHGELIYKSASGCRSIVRVLTGEDDARLHDISWCPVQFQRRVPGFDVRVHVVGEVIFATRIRSDAPDYRYAARDGLATELAAFELSETLADACRALSQALDLPFAGVDLRLQEQDMLLKQEHQSAWCFEVNPCPGFSYYESHTGQPIAAALARYLVGD
jgi:hypothetical protein